MNEQRSVFACFYNNIFCFSLRHFVDWQFNDDVCRLTWIQVMKMSCDNNRTLERRMVGDPVTEKMQMRDNWVVKISLWMLYGWCLSVIRRAFQIKWIVVFFFLNHLLNKTFWQKHHVYSALISIHIVLPQIFHSVKFYGGRVMKSFQLFKVCTEFQWYFPFALRKTTFF